jgi:peptide/nickel transport system substrate-binding protein
MLFSYVKVRFCTLAPNAGSRAVPSVVYAKNVSGVDLYTLGSPLPENIWMR